MSLTTLFSSTATLPEGVVKKTSTPGLGKGVNLGDIATVKYTCYLADQENAIPFARSEKQKMVRPAREGVFLFESSRS